ncbi:MAG: hypothetical protein ACXV2C_06390 [Candidatus Bathyarchaeia archaeon]
MAVMGAVRLDKLAATKSGHGLISFKATADTQNGTIFHAEDLATGERELFAPVQPATATIGVKPICINASVETVYLAGQTILDYVTPNGTAGRGYRPVKGDIITITDNVITGTTVVGQWVAPVNGSSQLNISSSLPTTMFIGKIIEKTTLYGQAATVIEVLAN